MVLLVLQTSVLIRRKNTSGFAVVFVFIRRNSTSGFEDFFVIIRRSSTSGFADVFFFILPTFSHGSRKSMSGTVPTLPRVPSWNVQR
jgi:hypothetical protein